MRRVRFKTGDVVTFRPTKEVIEEYGLPNEAGWIKVGNQCYSDEMYQKYKNNLYSICRIEDDRVIFFDTRGVWEKITTGMIKRVYKQKPQ